MAPAGVFGMLVSGSLRSPRLEDNTSLVESFALCLGEIWRISGSSQGDVVMQQQFVAV